MIVITGATGKLGGRIVEDLLSRAPGEGLAVSVRDPAKAQSLAGRGVRVRHGDFSKPATLASAFEGATTLLLVSSNAAAHGGDPLAQHRAAIDAARSAGVRRIVYTSHMGASASSAFPPMHAHAATEEMLRESGVAWTALRNGFYADTVPMLVGDAASTGVLNAPRDGKVAWTAHADLAAAAATILMKERFEGPTPPLTAPDALDLTDVAAILTAMYGRPVERQVIADDELERRMTARGVPAGAIATTLNLYRAARAGEFQTVDSALARLLGRLPTSLRSVLSQRDSP